MDGARFDDLTRTLTGGLSRRGLLRGALAAGLGLGLRRGTAQAACPPDQVERRKVPSGSGCVCRTTGRPPTADGCPCPNGHLRCDETCVDLDRDPAHCGACGVVCSADERCRHGACTCVDDGQACASRMCGPAITNCGATVNCGPLSGACPSGQACDAAGQCVCTPESCSEGCCDGDGVCRVEDDAACGIGGGACIACDDPETCAGGDIPGVCGCTPLGCTTETCGREISDGCGDTVICPNCERTFGFIFGAEIWNVPNDMTTVTFDAYGGAGGSTSTPGGEGGKGGRATATFAPPAASYQIIVGGMGPGGGGVPLEPFAGGGDGFRGGGGASDVRTGAGLETRILVAGGGGGGGQDIINGRGFVGGAGGQTGQPGSSVADGAVGGGGATQAGGGSGGAAGPNGQPGTDGQFGQGGAGGGNAQGGGGGGGGYYGGGGGGSGTFGGAGGGGGSSFGPAGTVYETGVRSGNGVVIATYRFD